METLPLWNNWLAMAWIVPLALAVSGVVDVLLVGRRVFSNPLEAAGISGLLGTVPLLFPPLAAGSDLFPDPTTIGLAMLAGAIYTWHLLYYFRVLFSANDVAYAEAFLSLAVLAVPLLSFVLLGERLLGDHYVAIGIATAGVAALTVSGGRRLLAKRAVTGALSAAVLCVSLSLVLEDAVFQRCDYWSGIFWFAAGGTLCAAYFAWRGGLRRALRTVRANKGALLATNATGLLALAASLRATDLSDSVSLVILIETTTPIIVMALCMTALCMTPLCRPLSPAIRMALRDQLDDAPVKVGAMAMILMGVMLIGLPHA